MKHRKPRDCNKEDSNNFYGKENNQKKGQFLLFYYFKKTSFNEESEKEFSSSPSLPGCRSGDKNQSSIYWYLDSNFERKILYIKEEYKVQVLSQYK